MTPLRPRRPGEAPAPRRRRFPWRGVTVSLVILAVLGVIAAGGYLASQSVYFIGTNSRGLVTVFSGLPYELPAGIKLYSQYYVSGVPAATVPTERRHSLLDNSLALRKERLGTGAKPRTGAARGAMNRPIVRVFGLVAVLFALLIGFTSRWTVFESASLRDNALNRRGLLEQERIARGRILAEDGSVLAHSVRSPEGTYQRRYPQGELFAHALGYYFTDLGDAGLERFRNDTLSGHTESGFQTILDQLQGKQPQGNDLVSTLDPSAQRTAVAALEGHRGSVVAIEPSPAPCG